jgi:hypothetical protein
MDAAVADRVAGVLGMLMLAGVILFLVLYYSLSQWRGSALGRHMLYFMVALALVLIIRTISFYWPGLAWLSYVRIFTYSLLTLAIWQRVYLLVRALRGADG